MADHFYSIAAVGQASLRERSKVVVGTSATGGNAIEVRITDGAITRQQAYNFLEWISTLIAAGDDGVISPGTLTQG